MLDVYKNSARQLVALKSVSADPAFAKDCAKTAKWLKDKLTEIGCKTEIFEGYGNPIVFGDYIIDPKLETCLIYGHYDVQPAAKEDGWDSDPFEMVEKDGKLYGRGIMDDKCQFLIHILAIGKLIQEKKLKYNIKFLFEGNEEVGSPFIKQFIEKHKVKLACDFVLISDEEMLYGRPTVVLGYRGMITARLTMQTAKGELHSGIHGGAIPNAIYELTKVIAGLYDENNTVTVEGFYKNVNKITEDLHVPFSMDEYKKISGVKTLKTEKGLDFYTQVGLRPAIVISSIYAGFLGEGHKTIIPHKATAKMNIRLVENQTPDEIERLLRAHLKKYIPDYVDYTFVLEQRVHPAKTERSNKYIVRATNILEKIYHKKTIFKYAGGTEPVIIYFKNILKKPLAFIPLASEGGNMHGVDENFEISHIEKGLNFSEKFFGS